MALAPARATASVGSALAKVALEQAALARVLALWYCHLAKVALAQAALARVLASRYWRRGLPGADAAGANSVAAGTLAPAALVALELVG